MENRSYSFGWIDFSSADMKRVREALAAISSGSMDELGISIIRDGFSDILFSGLSVAQTSLKYFLLIPAMLKKIELDSGSEIISKIQQDNSEGQLFRLIRSKLIKLECDFCDKACEKANDKTNIIGNDTANSDIPYEKRLVRFPHDIFWHGLYTFGLADAPTMRAYISNLQLRYRPKDGKKYSRKAVEEYWNKFFPFEPDDILKNAICEYPLRLTPDEKTFLYEKIAAAAEGKNTLWEKLIDNYENFELKNANAETIASILEKSGAADARDAANFSLYMRCAFLGFNIAYFYGSEEKVNAFLKEIGVLKNVVGEKFDLDFLNAVAKKFKYDAKKPQVLKEMKKYFELLNADFTAETIKEQMIRWEKAAKGGKAYLEKSNPAENEKWKGMEYLDFRLETALKLFGDQINETERSQQ